MLYKRITQCRICGNRNLKEVLNLGRQALTGVFPMPDEKVEQGPLTLMKCDVGMKGEHCGLLQLKHNYNMALLYGDNYGYRSGLNQSMVRHLGDIVDKIERLVQLRNGDLVIDIASNDGTLLKAYKNKKLHLLGIDPTSAKFKQYYPERIKYIPEFFSAAVVKQHTNQKAKIISSIAMFYDLERPIDFMKQVNEILDDNGIWVFEQSYMPMMIKNTSYDTICHEHLEYYALRQIQWMAQKVGLKIIDVEFNDTNGASFCIVMAKEAARLSTSRKITDILNREEREGYNDLKIYRQFERKVKKHRQDLISFLKKIKTQRKVVFGYGASTKGNVILQYCGIDKRLLPYVAEVNEYKFGRQTPGTCIPIISEKQAKETEPDYYLVLPWHFKVNILSREKEYLRSGGQFIFPLPKISIEKL